MKTFLCVLVAALLCAGAVCAASIDGKWVSQRKFERDGQAMTITQTFDLKAEGSKLTGSVSMAFGDREPRKMEISNGKIDGNKFSFTTVMSTPNGEFKTNYEGTVEGNTIKGTAGREGAEPRPFEAKRQ
jgi:opacity protein-like surface antigen